MYYIYKYEVNGEIIYIGKTQDIVQRVKTHSHCNGDDEKFLPYIDKAEIFVHKCESKRIMESLEKLLINYYKPILNVVDVLPEKATYDVTITDWKLYNENDFIKVQQKESVITSRKYLNREDIEKSLLCIERVYSLFQALPDLLNAEIYDADEIIKTVRKQRILSSENESILQQITQIGQFFVYQDSKIFIYTLWDGMFHVKNENGTEKDIVLLHRDGKGGRKIFLQLIQRLNNVTEMLCKDRFPSQITEFPHLKWVKKKGD